VISTNVIPKLRAFSSGARDLACVAHRHSEMTGPHGFWPESSYCVLTFSLLRKTPTHVIFRHLLQKGRPFMKSTILPVPRTQGPVDGRLRFRASSDCAN
jgi:hypothetical protein